jgi:AcrR family transcriptional regulator
MSTKRLPTHQRREQLADAALRLLTTEGTPALTVKRIAAEVGISDGAVFRHFTDKAALLDAAVERFASSLPAPPDAALPAVERLGRFFVSRTQSVQAQPEILGLALNDRLQEVVGDKSAERLRDVMQRSFAFVVTCLVQAQHEGALAAGCDPRVAAWMITGAMRGAARHGHDPEDAWRDVSRLLFADRSSP